MLCIEKLKSQRSPCVKEAFSPILISPRGPFTISSAYEPYIQWSPIFDLRCSGNSCCNPHYPWSSPELGQKNPGEPPGYQRRRKSSVPPCDVTKRICNYSNNYVNKTKKKPSNSAHQWFKDH